MRRNDYIDVYGTDSYKKEVRREKIRKRKFKRFIINSTILALAATGTGIVSYNKGVENGKKEATISIEKEHLRENDLSTAPNVILDKWADASLNRYYEYARGVAEEGNNNPIIKFENIKTNEYSQMKSAYQDYLETGSNESYMDFRNGAYRLQAALNSAVSDNSFDFDNSVFAYAVLVNNEGVIIDGNSDDRTLEIYVAEKFNTEDSYETDSIVHNGVVYQKYQTDEYAKHFTM